MVFVQLETSLAVLSKPVHNYEAEFVFSLRTQCLAVGWPGPAPGSRPLASCGLSLFTRVQLSTPLSPDVSDTQVFPQNLLASFSFPENPSSFNGGSFFMKAERFFE